MYISLSNEASCLAWLYHQYVHIFIKRGILPCLTLPPICTYLYQTRHLALLDFTTNMYISLSNEASYLAWLYHQSVNLYQTRRFLSCVCYALVRVCLFVPCGHLLSWLSFVVSNCEFVTFPSVSLVRCGTWLYRFLIFAPLLTSIDLPTHLLISIELDNLPCLTLSAILSIFTKRGLVLCFTVPQW